MFSEANGSIVTALQYRQCAGRAGRRGFDLLGNVVFHGVSSQKVCRLLSSRLPDLNGHFPITTTLVLRLFGLLHESDHARYAVDSINALLSQPRLYLGGESFKGQTMHHLRFSIEYLRRQQLLASDGVPLNFAGLVNHLYYTDNSAFAFHALLKEGFFHSLCANLSNSEEKTLRELMLVLAHLFKRLPCSNAQIEHYDNVVKPSSSVVFLPPLPAEAAAIIRTHNQHTLDLYSTYVRTFVKQHIQTPDDKLPLTGMKCGGKNKSACNASSLSLTARSPFVALSGAGEHFDSIHDLCSTVRSGVFLEEAVVPFVPLTDELNVPLNAWLLDFLKHGDVRALVEANFLRRSDVWFHLKDFSMILATIVTGLTNFLKQGNESDMDMLEVCDALELRETQKEEELAVAEASKIPETKSTFQRQEQLKNQPRSRVAESWDDEEDEDVIDKVNSDAIDTSESTTPSEQLSASSGHNEKGLRNVLSTFQKLQTAFDSKFKAMWA